MADASAVDVRMVVMDFLARREHSQLELKQKLKLRYCPESLISEVISNLSLEGLQSDERFAESFVRSRVIRGQGPLKIQAELQSRGVNDTICYDAIFAYKDDWLSLARNAVEKKFNTVADSLGYEERVRQMRFLQSRGFTSEQIHKAINTNTESID